MIKSVNDNPIHAVFNPETSVIFQIPKYQREYTFAMGGDRRSSHVVQRHGLVESRMRWKSHVRFGGRAGETDLSRDKNRALVRSHYANTKLDECRRRVQNETHI